MDATQTWTTRTSPNLAPPRRAGVRYRFRRRDAARRPASRPGSAADPERASDRAQDRRDRRRWVRRLKALAVFALSALVAAAAAGAWLGSRYLDKLLQPPRKPLEAWQQQRLDAPGSYGLRLTPATFSGDGGTEIATILAEPAPGGNSQRAREMRAALQRIGAAHPASGTVIVLHGRGGRKEDFLPAAERFCAAGFRCLLVDLRAHGESGGDCLTLGVKESADLRAVLDQAEEAFGKDIGPFAAFGYSMGGSTAVLAAGQDDRLQAVAAISAFADPRPILGDLLTYKSALGALPAVRDPAWEFCRAYARWEAGFDPEANRPADAAVRLATPIFVAHGTADTFVPPSHGRRLYDAPAHENKVWRPIPGAGHGDVFLKGGTALYAEIAAFFAEHLRR